MKRLKPMKIARRPRRHFRTPRRPTMRAELILRDEILNLLRSRSRAASNLHHLAMRDSHARSLIGLHADLCAVFVKMLRDLMEGK